MYNAPLGYFITFRTYGTWLHGDERGSVDRRHNRFGTPALGPDAARERFEAGELRRPPVVLDDASRCVVEAAIRGVVGHKGWALHALAVRTNHVHAVVTAGDARPEAVMNACKAWATRRLRGAGLAAADQRVWSRHGSTIYLFRPENLAEKIRYVCEGQ